MIYTADKVTGLEYRCIPISHKIKGSGNTDSKCRCKDCTCDCEDCIPPELEDESSNINKLVNRIRYIIDDDYEIEDESCEN